MGRCWEQLDKGWHSPTPAASPSSPDANFFPGDTEGDVLQPWRMVIITIAALWKTRNPPKSALQWNWVPRLQLNKMLKSAFPAPQQPGGHHRTPCNRAAGLAHPADLSPGPAPWTPTPWTPAPRPPGEPGNLYRQEHPAELGAAGPRESLGPREQWGNFLFGPDGPGELCRGFAQNLISTPAPESILPFLGGDFSQSGLHWCPFMLRLTPGNLNLLWYVFRFWVVTGDKD